MARGVSDMSAQLQKIVNARLYRQANYDTLTGIPNRQKFKDDMSQRIQGITNGELSEKDLHLLIMDIDHFKQVNDTYGHHV
jgi:diguanylate cyclase (GGDEF)-like protein